jgi:hypothetical protein
MMDVDLGPVGEQIGRGLNRAIVMEEISFVLGLLFGFLIYKYLLTKIINTNNKTYRIIISIFVSLGFGILISYLVNYLAFNFIDPSLSFMSFVDRK